MDREYMLGSTPRGNHWMGASSTSSAYRPSASSTSQQRRFRQSPSYDGSGPFITQSSRNEQLDSVKYTPSSQRKYSTDPQPLPLISPEVVDISRQRALALLVFAIIQGYKIYDLILLKKGLPVLGLLFNGSRINFIIKYFLIDSMFLYFLPTFKIPKLCFKSWAVFVQLVVMTLLTILISSEQEFVLLSVIASAWRKFNTKEMIKIGRAHV